MTLLKIAALALAASALLTTVAYGQSPPPRPPASAGAPANGAPMQALTAAELASVKATLAPFKPASLTAENAKLIKRTLRDAGLRRSPALDAALNAAGFSPAKLDQLDPPPPRPPRPADGGPPPGPNK